MESSLGIRHSLNLRKEIYKIYPKPELIQPLLVDLFSMKVSTLLLTPSSLVTIIISCDNEFHTFHLFNAFIETGSAYEGKQSHIYIYFSRGKKESNVPKEWRISEFSHRLRRKRKIFWEKNPYHLDYLQLSTVPAMKLMNLANYENILATLYPVSHPNRRDPNC